MRDNLEQRQAEQGDMQGARFGDRCAEMRLRLTKRAGFLCYRLQSYQDLTAWLIDLRDLVPFELAKIARAGGALFCRCTQLRLSCISGRLRGTNLLGNPPIAGHSTSTEQSKCD
jgi:hypothetical protein